MAQKSIREYDGKKLIADQWRNYISNSISLQFESVIVKSGKELSQLANAHPWLKTKSLVVKPDMLFGKRGKNNLVYFKDTKPGDITLDKAVKWIDERTSETTTLIDGTNGKLNYFIVEPFTPHEQSEEFYLAFNTDAQLHDTIIFSDEGGIDIEKDWEKKTTTIDININQNDKANELKIQTSLPEKHQSNKALVTFISNMYNLFKNLHFCYLEMNPFIIKNNTITLLDLVAKIDDTSHFLFQKEWEHMEFIAPFGEKDLMKEEKYIKTLDSKTGASLKLTILNQEGRIWTLVAGGGASVVYADTIAEKWGVSELANYGEYSGNPSTDETYEYTKTIFDLMTEKKHPENKSKILIIGGAIANFTDVAKTFKGIIKALENYADKLKEVNTKIFVRRGGPNYEVGLANIERAAKNLNLPIEVYGPNTHMTDIIKKAAKREKVVA